MTTNTEVEEAFDYGRMAKAIAFIHDNFKEQPSLEDHDEKSYGVSYSVAVRNDQSGFPLCPDGDGTQSDQ